MQQAERLRHEAGLKQGLILEVFSVAWMVAEAGIGIDTALTSHSVALGTFGLDSLIELAAGAVLVWRLYREWHGLVDYDAIQAAERTADRVVGVALLVLAGVIAVVAVLDVVFRVGAQPTDLGLALAAGASVAMPFAAWGKRRIGRAIGSRALLADGACSMVCAYMAWTLLAGLVLGRVIDTWWISLVAVPPLLYFVVQEGREGLEDEDDE